MIDPPDSTDSLRNFYPLFLKGSPLYQAVVRSTKELQPPLPSLPPKQQFSLNVSEINNLLQRFRIKSMSFEALMQLPISTLAPREKEFVLFLRRNPNIFKQLSSLDGHAETLSAKDVKIAAQLAGDALILSEEDLKYLKETVPTSVSKTAPADTPQYNAQDIINLLTKLKPQGIRFEELRTIPLSQTNLTDQEVALLRFLQSRPLQKILFNLSQPYQGLLTPEVIRVLTSLIWNPVIYGTVPIVFLKSPLQDEREISPLAPVDSVHVEEDRKKRSHPKQIIELHAAQMIEILKKLSPSDGHVTLEQLRHYFPKNPEEAKAINMLKRIEVFQALADNDNEPDTLSEKDIKLAMSDGAMILYDPYMVLVILP